MLFGLLWPTCGRVWFSNLRVGKWGAIFSIGEEASFVHKEDLRNFFWIYFLQLGIKLRVEIFQVFNVDEYFLCVFFADEWLQEQDKVFNDILQCIHIVFLRYQQWSRLVMGTVGSGSEDALVTTLKWHEEFGYGSWNNIAYGWEFLGTFSMLC